MDSEAKWAYIAALDDELLKGGATMSEWCAFIVRECDYAFVAGANLATVITAVAAIETYLRAEYAAGQRVRLADLLDRTSILQELRDDIHKLRRYLNSWVHVANPEDDQAILDRPEVYDAELEEWAKLAQRTLRRTIYENQWVQKQYEVSENLGYPTQKPVALMERILNGSSNPGDIVLHPFCGCGTTVHAAEKLGRQWIGIDVTHLAIGLIETRLRHAFPGID